MGDMMTINSSLPGLSRQSRLGTRCARLVGMAGTSPAMTPCENRCIQRLHPGIGNTAFAEANAAGRITWMSLPRTCVLTGAAPWFWPLTNLVGP